MTKEELLKVIGVTQYVTKKRGAMIAHIVHARMGGSIRKFGIESWPDENEQNEARKHLKEVVDEERRRIRKEQQRKAKRRKGPKPPAILDRF